MLKTLFFMVVGGAATFTGLMILANLFDVIREFERDGGITFHWNMLYFMTGLLFFGGMLLGGALFGRGKVSSRRARGNS